MSAPIDARRWREAIDALADLPVGAARQRRQLTAAARAATEAGRRRSAATIGWILGGAGASAHYEGEPEFDRARGHARAGQSAAAAISYERAGAVGHAAIERERSGELAAAHALWTRLAQAQREASRGDDAAIQHAADRSALGRLRALPLTARRLEARYVEGLAWLGVLRTGPAVGDATLRKARHHATTIAVETLERAAMRFEAVGLRERAYDAYAAIASVGAATRCFEHVVEGRANALRIVRADHLRTFALREYRDAIAACFERGEPAAAATFADEARHYARSIGKAADAATFTRSALALHVASARALAASKAPVEIAEGELREAIRCALDLRERSTARGLFEELAALEGISTTERARYQAAARRASADSQKSQAIVPSIDATSRVEGESSYVLEDVLDFERGGLPEEAAAAILIDRLARDGDAALDDPSTRAALMARLVALEPLGVGADRDASRRARDVEVARLLGAVGDYRALGALEALAIDADAAVRAAAVDAVARLRFKRSFVVLRAAAHDVERVVVERAIAAIVSRRSPVFIDPLGALVADSPDARVRTAALEALVAIDDDDAAAIVMAILEGGVADDRQALKAILERRPRVDRDAAIARAASARIAAGATPELTAVLRPLMG